MLAVCCPIFGQETAKSTLSEPEITDARALLNEAVRLGGAGDSLAFSFFMKARTQAESISDLPNLFLICREFGFFHEDNNDLHEAREQYLKALETAIKSGKSDDLLTIYTDLAILSRKMGRYVDCKNYHQAALELAEKTGDKEIIEDSHHGLGYLYEQIGDYEKAVSHFLKSLDLTQARGEKAGSIVTIQHIGKTWMQLDNRELALQYIRQAEELAIQLKNDSLLANVSHDFGEILVHFGDHSQALQKLNQGLNTYRKIGYKPYIASSLVYIGEVWSRMKQPDQTLGFFRQALDYEPFMDAYVRADLFHKFGKVWLEKAQPAEAEPYFQKSLTLAKANEFNDLLQENAFQLYRLAESRGQAGQALRWLEMSTTLKDSIFNVEKTRRVAELQLKYESERKERDIQTMRLRQNRTMLIGAVILLGLILGFLFFIARMSARNNRVLEQKNREIQHQNTQLSESNEVLRQYAYVAAHDLKEPLRTICSFVNLLEIRFGKNLDPEAVTYMKFVSDSAKRMNTLLTDLLQYSSIFNQKPGKEAVEVGKVVDEICFNLKGLLNQKNGEVTYPNDLPALQMSRVHLVQIFQNLVGNALKFVPEDRQPLIRITWKTDAKEVIFAVRDNGSGIEEQFREKIFNLFVRLHKHDEVEGTGIGLSICKSITEKYGGRIWFQSVLGQGTTFFFSFPNALIARDLQPEVLAKSA